MSESFITQTLHFARPGPANTRPTLEHAARRARELGLKKIVLATCTGRTAKEALDFFDPHDFTLIAVSHVTGFEKPDHQTLDESVRQELIDKGYKIITTTHAFGGVGRGVRVKLGSFQVDEIMAYTLRLLGQGVKVGVEMAYMAADQGLVRTDEDVLTIAGTGRGADTALVLQPAHSANCLELKVREIVAKPWRP